MRYRSIPMRRGNEIRTRRSLAGPAFVISLVHFLLCVGLVISCTGISTESALEPILYVAARTLMSPLMPLLGVIGSPKTVEFLTIPGAIANSMLWGWGIAYLIARWRRSDRQPASAN